MIRLVIGFSVCQESFFTEKKLSIITTTNRKACFSFADQSWWLLLLCRGAADPVPPNPDDAPLYDVSRDILSSQQIQVALHCHQNNLNLHIKTEPVLAIIKAGHAKTCLLRAPVPSLLCLCAKHQTARKFWPTKSYYRNCVDVSSTSNLAMRRWAVYTAKKTYAEFLLTINDYSTS